MTSTQTVDGRSARAQRTRDSVVDAVLDLVATGQTRPTAREIADAAGISVRSVYVHFDDLDDLFRAAADRHFPRPRSPPLRADGVAPPAGGRDPRPRRTSGGLDRPADPDPRALRRG